MYSKVTEKYWGGKSYSYLATIHIFLDDDDDFPAVAPDIGLTTAPPVGAAEGGGDLDMTLGFLGGTNFDPEEQLDFILEDESEAGDLSEFFTPLPVVGNIQTPAYDGETPPDYTGKITPFLHHYNYIFRVEAVRRRGSQSYGGGGGRRRVR